MPRVSISATQKVRYNRTIEMNASDFAEYEQAVAESMPDKWFHNFAERFLDPIRDEPDADDFDDVYVERSAS